MIRQQIGSKEWLICRGFSLLLSCTVESQSMVQQNSQLTHWYLEWVSWSPVWQHKCYAWGHRTRRKLGLPFKCLQSLSVTISNQLLIVWSTRTLLSNLCTQASTFSLKSALRQSLEFSTTFAPKRWSSDSLLKCRTLVQHMSKRSLATYCLKLCKTTRERWLLAT